MRGITNNMMKGKYMRKIALVTLIALPVVLLLAFATSAYAQIDPLSQVAIGAYSTNNPNGGVPSGYLDGNGDIAPHGNYSLANPSAAYAQYGNTKPTDFCLQCHMVHDAEGDYALMREQTVTQTCATCHNVFGHSPTGQWTRPRLVNWNEDPNEVQPTTAIVGAYKNETANNGAGPQSEHGLGVILDGNGNVVNGAEGRAGADDIAGECDTDASRGGTSDGGNPTNCTNLLKVISPASYAAGLTNFSVNAGGPIYSGQESNQFAATNGLYCASCHSVHGSVQANPNTMTSYKSCYIDSEGVYRAVGADTPAPAGATLTNCPTSSLGSFGKQLVTTQGLNSSTTGYPHVVFPDRLLSDMPNHSLYQPMNNEATSSHNGDVQSATWDGTNNTFKWQPRPAETYNEFCMTCHTMKNDSAAADVENANGTNSADPSQPHNHPPLCTSCHGNPGNGSFGQQGNGNGYVNDFPHSSGNEKFLTQNSDKLCLGCHSPANGQPDEAGQYGNTNSYGGAYDNGAGNHLP